MRAVPHVDAARAPKAPRLFPALVSILFRWPLNVSSGSNQKNRLDLQITARAESATFPYTILARADNKITIYVNLFAHGKPWSQARPEIQPFV